MKRGASLSALDRHIRLQTVEGLLVEALAILDEESTSLAESLAVAQVDHALHHVRAAQTNVAIS